MIQRLEVEVDEMASFVQKKANKQWIWLAMNATTRQVIAFYVGNRSRRSAQRLWAKIPDAYRQHATFYTDQYVVYAGVIPAAQHRAISKLARKTNHIERFNNTLRQRVSRLVRDALSFSKKLAHHIGAINPTTLSRFDMTVGTQYALPAYYAQYQEAMYVTSVSDGRRRVCDSRL
jgi:insertion element IS1 protein InsB